MSTLVYSLGLLGLLGFDVLVPHTHRETRDAPLELLELADLCRRHVQSTLLQDFARLRRRSGHEHVVLAEHDDGDTLRLRYGDEGGEQRRVVDDRLVADDGPVGEGGDGGFCCQLGSMQTAAAAAGRRGVLRHAEGVHSLRCSALVVGIALTSYPSLPTISASWRMPSSLVRLERPT